MAGSNTLTYLKETIKRGFLAVTFLVSFFVLSGFVNNNRSSSQVTYTEVYRNAHFLLKNGISYKRAALTFYKEKPSRFVLKRNFNRSVSAFNKLTLQQYKHLKQAFLFTKCSITYQVWNLLGRADRDAPCSLRS